jgi:hypothetical protein
MELPQVGKGGPVEDLNCAVLLPDQAAKTPLLDHHPALHYLE